jgi:hypothetical protein
MLSSLSPYEYYEECEPSSIQLLWNVGYAHGVMGCVNSIMGYLNFLLCKKISYALKNNCAIHYFSMKKRVENL